MTDIQNSDIFGEHGFTPSIYPPEGVSAEPTAAGKLVSHLKYIADKAVFEATDRALWLGYASNQGQTSNPAGMINRQYVAPEAIDGQATMAGWQLPTMPNLLTLPAIPDNLKIDFSKLKTDVAADIVALQNSWMARYLPDVTSVDALNTLVSNALDGTNYNSAKTKLDNLEAATKAALLAISNSTQTALNTAITTSKASLTGNIATSQANVDDALAAVTTNVQDIAWSRARDQIAREAARLDQEAIGAWASRGFSLPGGVLASQQAKARQATLNAASEQAAVQAEKVQQALIDIAKLTVGSWMQALELQNNAEIASYKAIVETSIKFAELDLDANKAKAKQAFDHLGLTLDFTKFAAGESVKYRLGVMEAMNGLITAYARLMSNEKEYIDSIALAERNAQSAILDYYRAAIQSAEVGLKVEMVNNENDLKFTETAARFIGQAVASHVQAASAAAEVFSRVAGNALSGLNGIASVAASG